MAKRVQIESGKFTYTHKYTQLLETQRPCIPPELLLLSHEIQLQVQFSVFKRDTALQIISSSNTMRHTHGKKTLQHCERIPLLIHLDHQRALLFSPYYS